VSSRSGPGAESPSRPSPLARVFSSRDWPRFCLPWPSLSA
jgi:hypothetical protein